MKTCKLVADKYGRLHTPSKVASAEYLEYWGNNSHEDQIIADYWENDPATLEEDCSEEKAQALLFGLYETGQIDYKVYSRTIEFPNGRKVTV